MEGLNIFQWNANGLAGHGSELKAKFKIDKGPHVACIQETKFSHKTKFNLPNYNAVRTDRSKTIPGRTGGGLIIYVREDIKYKEVKVNTPNLEANGIQVTINNQKIKIINIYHSTLKPIKDTDLDILYQLGNKSTIFLGDFNAHHPTWGIADKLDNHGQLISEWIEKNDLILLNNNQPTRYDKIHHTMSAIDLSICTPDLAQSLMWDVHPEPLGSDHFPINITLGNLKIPNQTPKQEPKFQYKNANWDKFQELCNQANLNDLETKDPETFCQNLTNFIINAAKSAIPFKSFNPGKPTVPWWNEEIELTRQKRKSAFNRAKRDPSHLKTAHELNHQVQNLVKTAKTKN